MPEVSPENHSTHRRRSRSRSRHRRRSRTVSPRARNTLDHSKKKSDRSRSCDRTRGHSDRHAESGGSRTRTHDTHQRAVRVKEEPTSDDDDGRRRRRWRGRGRYDSGVQQVKTEKGTEPEKPKEKVNFGLSGKLAEDTNVFNGIVIKYSEPGDARKPIKHWRLYPFKGDQTLPMLPIHRQSAYLLGRDRKVADIPIDHPSCSKQHAVLQFRSIPYERDDGRPGRRIRPYIIDLESANGTFVNNNKIEPKRYVELLERDVIKFGFSSREYVLLHEGSTSNADGDEDDEAQVEVEEQDVAAQPDEDNADVSATTVAPS